MNNFVLIIVFLLLGALFKRSQLLPESTSQRLNEFVIFICLPAIVLLKIPEMKLDYHLLLPSLLPWLMVVLIATLIIMLARYLNWSRSITGCALMLSCFGNTSFFGFPMVGAFFGEAGLSYAIIYDLLGSFLSLAVVGNIFLTTYGNSRVDASEILWRVVSFPPFIAIVAALFLSDSNYPPWIVEVLESLAQLLVPVTMFLVGMHLVLRVKPEIRQALKIVLLAKLILMPGLMLLVVFGPLGNWVNTSSDSLLMAKVTLFEAAMPPMVTASVMAIHAKLKPELAAAAVGLGLFFSCVSLPLWYLIIESLN